MGQCEPNYKIKRIPSKAPVATLVTYKNYTTCCKTTVYSGGMSIQTQREKHFPTRVLLSTLEAAGKLKTLTSNSHYCDRVFLSKKLEQG
jgi:hypothetical protein